MAQFDFPSTPSNNQTYTSNGVTFKWDGVAWRRNTTTGAQGNQGAQGHQGNNGAQGSPGTGAQGAQGHQGNNGAQGSPGTGAQGAQGHQGNNGAQGDNGNSVTGAQGAQGYQGDSGSSASFTSISGTPSSYTARKYLRVNDSGNALEYVNSGVGLGAVNVKDYGATGDGSTDDRTSIINAISALGANGGTVFFPPGRYRIDSTITVNGNSGGNVVTNCIRLVGLSSPAQGGITDAGGSELYVDGGDNHTIFNFVGVEAVHMVNLRVRGGNFFAASGSGSHSSAHALKFEKTTHGGNDILLENMVFCGVTRCVHLEGTGRVTLRKLTIGHVPDASGDIIRLEADSNSNRMDQIRIEGCVIDGSMHPDQDASRNSANGIGIYEHTNTIFISNTSVIRCNYNFYCDSGWNGEFLYFVNSEAERAKVDGFYINGGEFISIDNCFSCSNYRDGIRIDGNTTTSVSITNPNVRINGGHGINHQSGGLQDLSIVNPRIGGNNATGSGYAGQGNANTYSGIRLANGTHNVYIGGGKSGGDGNLSGSGSQRAGVSIEGTSHDNVRVIGINVQGNNFGTLIDGSWGGSWNWMQMNPGSTDYKSHGGL